MRAVAFVTIVILFCGCFFTQAFASPYEGLTVEQIKALPGFTSSVYGDRIGYILTTAANGERILIDFDEHGYPLTCILDTGWDEPIPAWVAPAMEYLVDCGLLSTGCMMNDFAFDAMRAGFDTDEALRRLGLLE